MAAFGYYPPSMPGRVRVVGATLLVGMTVAACGSSNTNGSAPAATSSQTTLTTNASVPCDGQQGPNPAMPEFYQEQYSSGLADSLKRDLASYDAAGICQPV